MSETMKSPPGATARWRVGAVSYLNTKPLVCGLDERASRDGRVCESRDGIELSFDLPSRLADDLAAGRLDVALIPSIEYFLEPAYEIVSDACIACRGPVLSVKLLSRTPMREIRSLALDEGSRTSVALARILLDRRFGLSPRLESLPIGADASEATTDAVLLIGDRAIHPPEGEFIESWDLGEEWNRWAELPFVFAMWVARPGLRDGKPLDDGASSDGSSSNVTSSNGSLFALERVARALSAARDAGVASLSEIAEREAPHVRLTPSACLSYLRDNLYFFLGPRERAGLALFHRYAAELGLAPFPATEGVDESPTGKMTRNRAARSAV